MCLAYFYCTISDFASQDARNVLGSLVAQLSATAPSILDDIRSIYNKGAKNKAHRFPIELSVLEAAILQSASGKTKIVLLVDAINESHDMQLLEASLLRLASLSTNIRVLITTTSMGSIKHPNTTILNISGKSRGDIGTFIKYRLQTDSSLSNLAPDFRAEIEFTLLKNADGSSV